MSKRHYYYVVGQSNLNSSHWFTMGLDHPVINNQAIQDLNAALLTQAQKFNPQVTSVYIANIVYLGKMTEEEWYDSPANQG